MYLDVSSHRHFHEYVDALQRRDSYSLFVPGRNRPYAQEANDTTNSLLVVFHKSWVDMMDLFES